MSVTLTARELGDPTRGKRQALLWCVAAGVGSGGALKALRWIWGRLAIGVDAPAGVPNAWWIVDQRATGFAIRELIVLALFAGALRLCGLRLSNLGYRNRGTWAAWLVAGVALLLGLVSHPFVRSGPYPVTWYTLYAGLAIGIPVALLEESVFRGFAVSTLQTAGFGRAAQILFTGVLFGLVHISYTGMDWTVPVFTGVLGCLWSWVFIRGGNSLWPTLVAHAINDAVLMPYFYVHGVY